MESLDGPTLSGCAHRRAERHHGGLVSRLVSRIQACRPERPRTPSRIAPTSIYALVPEPGGGILDGLVSHHDADHGDETDGQRVGQGDPTDGRWRWRASRGAGGKEHRERAAEPEMESLARQCGARAAAYRRPAMATGVDRRRR